MKVKASLLFLLLLLLPGLAFAGWRRGIVTFKIDLKAPEDAKTVRLWFPYPVSDEHQRIEDVVVDGNFASSAVYREPESGALYLYAEWVGDHKERTFEMTFRAEARERTVKELREADAPIPKVVERYLESNYWVPTDGEIRRIAETVTAGRKGILEKARAVYDWVVENTFRDPKIKGCGLGIVEQTLARRGGKCADISSVFVALARAAGVPAREVFGLRLGEEAQQDITKGHHCWAEFYLPGTGWVPVDPADVRKVMLVKDLSLEEAEPYRRYFFGSVDKYRIVLEKGGRGLTLYPPQDAGPLNYLMYPYAEADGRALDYLDPEGFSYSIHFRALQGGDEGKTGLPGDSRRTRR